MIGGKAANRPAFRQFQSPFTDQLHNHLQHPGIIAGGGGADVPQTDFRGVLPGLQVQIVEHLHMIGHKAEGRDHDGGDPVRLQGVEVIADVRIQPGHLGRSAAALIDQIPGGDFQPLGHQPRRLPELAGVVGGLRHRHGNAVSREHQPGPVPLILRKQRKGLCHLVGHRLDEQGMIVKHTDFVEGRSSLPQFRLRGHEIFPILAAARIATEAAGDVGQHLPVPCLHTLLQHVRNVRRGISIGQEHRQVDPGCWQAIAQFLHQLPVLSVDGADTAKQLVVMRNLQLALLGNPFAPENIVQKRHHLLHALRAAKGNNNDCVILHSEILSNRFAKVREELRMQCRFVNAPPDMSPTDSARSDSESLYGLHPALEALRAGRRRCLELLLDQQAGSERMQPLLRAAEQAGVPVRRTHKQELFNLCGSKQHQGVVLRVTPFPYTPLDDSVFEQRRLLLLDNIEDPRNAGAILRSADLFGFHTVLMPLRGGSDVYPSVVKTSAGASEHLHIVRAANSTRYVKRAKEGGYRVVALDMHGSTELKDVPVQDSRPLLLVIGGEDKRIGQFILNEADVTARIPQTGRVNSLNASVAAGIALYHFADTE